MSAEPGKAYGKDIAPHDTAFDHFNPNAHGQPENSGVAIRGANTKTGTVFPDQTVNCDPNNYVNSGHSDLRRGGVGEGEDGQGRTGGITSGTVREGEDYDIKAQSAGRGYQGMTGVGVVDSTDNYTSNKGQRLGEGRGGSGEGYEGGTGDVSNDYSSGRTRGVGGVTGNSSDNYSSSRTGGGGGVVTGNSSDNYSSSRIGGVTGSSSDDYSSDRTGGNTGGQSGERTGGLGGFDGKGSGYADDEFDCQQAGEKRPFGSSARRAQDASGDYGAQGQAAGGQPGYGGGGAVGQSGDYDNESRGDNY